MRYKKDFYKDQIIDKLTSFLKKDFNQKNVIHFSEDEGSGQ